MRPASHAARPIQPSTSRLWASQQSSLKLSDGLDICCEEKQVTFLQEADRRQGPNVRHPHTHLSSAPRRRPALVHLHPITARFHSQGTAADAQAR